MAIIPSNVTFTAETTSGSGLTNYLTSRLTPTSGAQVVVPVQVRTSSGAVTGSPTLTGGGVSTWTLRNTATVNDFGNDDSQFVFWGTATASAGTLAFEMPSGEDFSTLVIGAFEGIGASNFSTNNEAEAQIGSGGASDPMNISYPGTRTTNGVLFYVHGGFSDGHTQTPGSGFTEFFDANVVGNQGMAAAYSDTNQSVSSSLFGSTTGARLGFVGEFVEAGGGGGGATTRRLINKGLINGGLINNGLV